MSTDLQRLRDAADVMHAVPRNPVSKDFSALLIAVGDWLESTATRAGFTARDIDLEHAHKVADAILGDTTEAGQR